MERDKYFPINIKGLYILPNIKWSSYTVLIRGGNDNNIHKVNPIIKQEYGNQKSRQIRPYNPGIYAPFHLRRTMIYKK